MTRRAAVWAALPRAGPVAERELGQGVADRLADLDGRLDGRAQGDDLVDVDAGPWRLAGHLRDVRANHRHAGRSTHQQHAVEALPVEPCLAQGFLGQPPGAVHEGERHGLELRPGKLEALSPRTELQGDPGRRPLREGPLGLLAAQQNLVERDRVVERIEAGLGGELLGQERGDPVVPVLAAQVVVAGSGQHRDVLGCNPGDGHVEGAAAQVVDQDGLASRSLSGSGRRREWRPWAR